VRQEIRISKKEAIAEMMPCSMAAMPLTMAIKQAPMERRRPVI
jgi:hypothetical protein